MRFSKKVGRQELMCPERDLAASAVAALEIEADHMPNSTEVTQMVARLNQRHLRGRYELFKC
jgi:hypothetical protein